MRGLALLVALLSLLAVSGSAVAQSATVTITKNGYVPQDVTVLPGATITFTNSDSVAHQVSFKSGSGFTCAPNPLVLQPGASGSCVFQTAGSYSYSDPNVRGKTYRGSVTVTAPPDSLTMTATPTLLTFGGKISATGTVSTAKAAESVDVLAQQCGAGTPQKVTTVQTVTGGGYSFSTQPVMNTVYTTSLRKASSSPTVVQVKPRLRLGRVAPHRYSLRVYAGQTLAGKYVSLQRYNGALKRWATVKAVALKANASGVAPTVVSAASFSASVKSGLRIRVVISQAQVGTCFAAGNSNTILA